MKSVHTFLVIAMLCGMSFPAAAADWVPLSKASKVDRYFYDRSKLTIKGNEITYWKKVVFTVPQPIQGRQAASGLLRERIDCEEHTAKLISYLYYTAEGETLEYVAKDESEAAPIIPDTVGDAFERALCPRVWQKQEEARIKAEQKAAEAELEALRKPQAVPPQPAAPASDSAPAPAMPAADSAPPPAGPSTAAPSSDAPAEAAPSTGEAPEPASAPLPEPKVLEQLY